MVTEDPQATSALLAAYGAVKFKFVDMSGCEGLHSPKDRADHKVKQALAQGTGADGTAKRGYTRIVETGEDGAQTVTGWAKRKDKPIYDEAERVLKAALRECGGLIQRYSIKVGGARAVPSTRYTEFQGARTRCKEIAGETNNHPAVVSANDRLRAEGQPLISLTYTPNLFPELSLSDPEDLERAERIRSSVAEAIALVCDACRSGDRERIRYVIEQVGALGEAVSDPVMAEQVQGLLGLAERTVEAITARGRAQSATIRANPETVRGQEAAERFLAAQATETTIKAELAQVATQVAATICEAIETDPVVLTSQGPQDADLGAIELEAPTIIESAEDTIVRIATEGQPAKEPGTDFSGIEL